MAVAAGLCAALAATTTASAAPAATTAARPHPAVALPPGIVPACPLPPSAGQMSCFALLNTNVSPDAGRPAGISRWRRPSTPADDGDTDNYTPSDLQSAYNLAGAAAQGGKGETVALIEAGDDPSAEQDLAVYRSAYGLPACTTANGCFSKVNQEGQQSNYPPEDDGWAIEESLDVDMVSAICPLCHILVVEADDQGVQNLGAANDEAVALGAKFVSNSWGTPEDSQLTPYDGYFDHPGVAITVATGDSGYGSSWPAVVPTVTAVGGTSLLPAANPRGWNEIAWSGGGSGCSAVEPKPAWQQDPGCSTRAVADVSAVADPTTGVSMYDSQPSGPGEPPLGWTDVGGTSVATPIIASVYALAGTPKASTDPAEFPYQHPGDLNDIIAGRNYFGSCTPTYICVAGPGYDGPTGLGTPNGTGAFG
jgi:subtilase family serine protease